MVSKFQSLIEILPPEEWFSRSPLLKSAQSASVGAETFRLKKGEKTFFRNTFFERRVFQTKFSQILTSFDQIFRFVILLFFDYSIFISSLHISTISTLPWLPRSKRREETLNWLELRLTDSIPSMQNKSLFILKNIRICCKLEIQVSMANEQG